MAIAPQADDTVSHNGLTILSLLSALVLAAALPDRELYRFSAPISYLALGVQALGTASMGYSLYPLDLKHSTGLRQ